MQGLCSEKVGPDEPNHITEQVAMICSVPEAQPLNKAGYRQNQNHMQIRFLLPVWLQAVISMREPQHPIYSEISDNFAMTEYAYYFL